jgi:hypothetical protein
MNNTGSDSPVESNESAPPPTTRRVPAKIIVLGLIAIVFAVVIGSQVIGVLYAIFFPPATPVPDQVTLVSHSSKDYGTDDWLYTSNKLSACDVVHFYESKDSQCRIAPTWCTDENSIQTPAGSSSVGQNVARCVATQNFSIFALRWEVVIATGTTSNETSQFRLNREIFWTGAVPPSNPPSLNGGFPETPTEEPSATTAS